MKLFSRIIKALNQSSKLIFVAIGNVIWEVYHLVYILMHFSSNVIKLLHKFIAAIIQIFLNVTSVAFIIFIPIIFFFDPLSWARHLEGAVGDQVLFNTRMAIGAFFSLVAFFLVKELYKTWKESDEDKEEKKQRSQNDFMGFISQLLAWVVILALLLYFTVFKYKFFPMEIYFQHLPFWVQDLLIVIY